jgi:O-antigen ligase
MKDSGIRSRREEPVHRPGNANPQKNVKPDQRSRRFEKSASGSGRTAGPADSPAAQTPSKVSRKVNTGNLGQIVLGICAGLCIAAAILLLPLEFLPFFILLGILFILAVLILRRPAWLLYTLVLLSAIVCMGKQFESISVAGTSIGINGLGWGFAAGIMLVLLGGQFSRVGIPKFTLPFLALVGWTAVRWVSTAPVQLSGMKDILFYGLPPLAAIFTLFVLSTGGGMNHRAASRAVSQNATSKNSAASPAFYIGTDEASGASCGGFASRESGIMRRVEDTILATGLIPAGLYLFLIPAGLVTYSSQGPIGLLETRGIALYLLIVLAVALARWRYAESQSGRQTAAACGFLALATILFTLSRMAGFAAILLLALGLSNPHSLRRLAFGSIAAGLAAAAAVFFIPALRERFFSQESTDLITVLQSLKTSGRSLFWPATFEHAIANPLIGWGPGSARVLVAEVFRGGYFTEYYPHNEYLQVFHDMGAIGAVLLLLGYIPLCLHFWRKWRTSHTLGSRPQAARNLAAFLCITAVIVSSITANTLHYAFVTVPAFILAAFAVFQNRLQNNPDGEQIAPSDS